MNVGTLARKSAVLFSIGFTAGHLQSQERIKIPMSHHISYRTAKVDGLSIFYREAGPKDAPTILFLHGLPSSSRMFEPLLSRLSDRYPPGRAGLSGIRPQRLAGPEDFRVYVRSLRRAS